MKKLFANKKIQGALYMAAGVSVGLLALVEPALARSFKDVVQNANDNVFNTGMEFISGLSYIIGVGFVFQAALKFKEHNDDPQRIKLSKPITYAIVGGILLSLPTAVDMMANTSLGDGTDKATIGGTRLQNATK